MRESRKLNQKGVVVQALILIPVVIGIVAGVYLVQKTQIFKPKADSNTIAFIDRNGIPLPSVVDNIPQTVSPTVKVKLSSPLGGPPALVAPDSTRVFLTSKTYTSNLGGISGADAKCQALADNPDDNPATTDSLGGKWLALVSDRNTDVKDRIKSNDKGYKLINGSKIADNYENLFSNNGLQVPLNIDQTGKIISGAWDPKDLSQRVWTGSKANGNFGEFSIYGDDCNQWNAVVNGFVYTGSFPSAQFWLDSQSSVNPLLACGIGRSDFDPITGKSTWVLTEPYNFRLYCFEDPQLQIQPLGSPAVYTVSYKLAEAPHQLATASAQIYYKDSIKTDYTFKDISSGIKTLFVEFTDNLKNLATKSAQIKLVTQTPSPSPSTPPLSHEISSCGAITESGNYTISPNFLLSNAYSCITIKDVNDVTIDCNNNNINLDFGDSNSNFIVGQNVKNLTIKSCNFKQKYVGTKDNPQDNPNKVEMILKTIFVDKGESISITNNSFTKASVAVENSNKLIVKDNTITGSISIGSVNNGLIEKNTVTNSNASRECAALINSSGGTNNIIRGNTTDGLIGADGRLYCDDGIFLTNETGALVEDNTMKNNWDVGLETMGYVKNSKIVNNITTNTRLGGIGGWYHNSLSGNEFSGNKVYESRMLFYFFRSNQLDNEGFYKQDSVDFKDNKFSNNKLINSQKSTAVASFIAMDAENITDTVRNDQTKITLDKVHASNNSFINNDFGINNSAPLLVPVNSIIDGGGNICSKEKYEYTNRFRDYTIALNCSNSTPSPSPSPSASPVVPPPPPAGGGGGGSGGGGGGGSSSGGGGGVPAKKTIKYIKYAEDPYSLSSAPRVPYYPGDPLPYTFKNSPQGNKYFIFVRFEDANGQVFKINGQDYITQSIDVVTNDTSSVNPPSGGGTPQVDQPTTKPSTEEVIVGNASLSTPASVNKTGSGWGSVSINLSISGFSTPGRSIAGLFVRNQTGTCTINDCGYSGWTQIRSYGSNGTDGNSWSAPADFAPGIHMFGVFSLNADGTAGSLLAVSSTNFENSSSGTGGSSSGGSTVNCTPTVTPCTCGGSDPSSDDYAGVCKINPGGCNGGWCKAGVCETCSQ